MQQTTQGHLSFMHVNVYKKTQSALSEDYCEMIS